MPVLTKTLSTVTADKSCWKRLQTVFPSWTRVPRSSVTAKGNIIYDKETKDTELVKWEESIEDYMARGPAAHPGCRRILRGEPLVQRNLLSKPGGDPVHAVFL